MNRSIKRCITTLTLGCLLITGCQQGPAEKKGKKIDNAVQSFSDKLQNKGPLQKAGEKIDDLTEK